MSAGWSQQFLRFAGVGGLATGLQYLILIVLVESQLSQPTLATAIGYGSSALFSYWANYHFTFASEAAHHQALPRFAAITICGLALNTAIMWLLNVLVGWHYLLAQVLATGIVLVWNFTANRRWTYS